MCIKLVIEISLHYDARSKNIKLNDNVQLYVNIIFWLL